jgi:transcription elongation factor Elf1
MTVGKKLKTTLASLKSCQANLESFALETENEMAKDMYTQFADQAKTLVEGIKTRVKDMEEQEPQYKGN